MTTYVGRDTPLARYVLKSNFWVCDRVWIEHTSTGVKISGFTFEIDWTLV